MAEKVVLVGCILQGVQYGQQSNLWILFQIKTANKERGAADISLICSQGEEENENPSSRQGREFALRQLIGSLKFHLQPEQDHSLGPRQ